MKRTFWIAGFVIAILWFALFSVLSAIALIKQRGLSVSAWSWLAVSVAGVWHLGGRLCVVIRSGDPTGDVES
jgi:hypothetical protein